MVKQNADSDHQLTRSAAIVWCCVLPNLLILILAGIAWQLNVFGDWQPTGLQLLTSAETLHQVRNVVGIGGRFLTVVLLSLILIPNMVITVLVSGRGFQSAKSAFVVGLLVCLLLPAVTITMLTLVQPS